MNRTFLIPAAASVVNLFTTLFCIGNNEAPLLVSYFAKNKFY